MTQYKGVTILVGGQYGSEGKGKIAAYLAHEYGMAIRTGGPNAGHTIEYEGRVYKLQSIPCSFINPSCLLGIGAGAVIDLDILTREIVECDIANRKLVIDPFAAIIDSHHVESEVELRKRIGSTGKGVGATVSAKVDRHPALRLAKDIPELEPYTNDVAQIANKVNDRGEKVFLEGTQGFGLSLHHGSYPFVTSRDTTASAFLSEAGLSPLLVDQIIMVIRPYPIRVAGNSGLLFDEVDWKTVTEESGYPTELVEMTTVTKKVRRVGRFDIELVERAVMTNRPTQLALLFADYLGYENKGIRNYSRLNSNARSFIDMLERVTDVPVTIIGTGSGEKDIIDLRGEKL